MRKCLYLAVAGVAMVLVPFVTAQISPEDAQEILRRQERDTRLKAMAAGEVPDAIPELDTIDEEEIRALIKGLYTNRREMMLEVANLKQATKTIDKLHLREAEWAAAMRRVLPHIQAAVRSSDVAIGVGKPIRPLTNQEQIDRHLAFLGKVGAAREDPVREWGKLRNRYFDNDLERFGKASELLSLEENFAAKEVESKHLAAFISFVASAPEDSTAEYIRAAKDIGLNSSIISEARQFAETLDIVGLSIEEGVRRARARYSNR